MKKTMLGIAIFLLLYTAFVAAQNNEDTLDWYQSMGSIRTRTNDANPSLVVTEIIFGYTKADTDTYVEIAYRNVEIKDYLRRYFTEKTREELRIENKDKLRIEIRNAINNDILTKSKIQDVKFLVLEVTEPEKLKESKLIIDINNIKTLPAMTVLLSANYWYLGIGEKL